MARTATRTRLDIYQEVTDNMVDMLEAGTRPWERPWQTNASSSFLPLRHNGVGYRGINVLILWASAMSRGFQSPHWLTFRQAQALGGMVKKGSLGTGIVYANTIAVTEDDNGGEARRIPFLKRYTVFNADQIEGLADRYPEPVPVLANRDTRDADLEELFGKVGATVQHGGASAHYTPALDIIQMPDFEAFTGADGYYATLAHEQVHMTGHPDRLARPTLGAAGRADYAREELVAELGAAFVGATIGIKVDSREDHAAYLASWVGVLKADKRAIFTAAREAQRAADYLLDRMELGTAEASPEEVAA